MHVFENLGYFWHHPGEIFGLQLVGLAIYVVIGGGLVGLIAYCLWKRLPLLKVLDSTALAFPVAQIIGKTANVINGDTWGNPTDLPWGIIYVNPYSFIPDDLLGVATHPNPIYEQIWLLVVVGILLVTILASRPPASPSACTSVSILWQVLPVVPTINRSSCWG